MANYRYRRLDFAEFLLTTPKLQTEYSEFLNSILDKPLTLIQNTYIVYVIEKYSYKTKSYKRVSWAVFDLASKRMVIAHDPSKTFLKLIKQITEELENSKL